MLTYKEAHTESKKSGDNTTKVTPPEVTCMASFLLNYLYLRLLNHKVKESVCIYVQHAALELREISMN